MMTSQMLQLVITAMDRSAEFYGSVTVPTIAAFNDRTQRQIDEAVGRAKTMLELVHGIVPISAEAVREYETLMKRVTGS